MCFMSEFSRVQVSFKSVSFLVLLRFFCFTYAHTLPQGKQGIVVQI